MKKKLDGLILAAAGIKCLNLENKISLTFDISQIIPAPGQGIIAAQCRKKDNLIKKILTSINDKETCFCALAERSMLKTVGGDCETAIGGFAEVKDKILFLKAELFSDDGNECFKYEMKGKDTEAEEIGKKVGSKLLELAGEKFKKMNILITRPLIDVEDNMGKLFSLGHKIIHMPTLKILPKNEKPINVEKYDAFIFTSANAVRNLNILKQDKKNMFLCWLNN